MNKYILIVAYIVFSMMMLISAGLFLAPVSITCLVLSPFIYSNEIKHFLRKQVGKFGKRSSQG